MSALDIKGKKFEFAGFSFVHKGSELKALAEFNYLDPTYSRKEEKERPDHHYGKLVKEFSRAMTPYDPDEPIIINPTLSIEDIVFVLTGENKPKEFNNPISNPQELVDDLSQEQLSSLLIALGDAKKAYLKGETRIFVGKPFLKS